MKVVLFCGGLGTRMREYSVELPKPLVALRGRPIVCHIMDYYARHGHHDFILCLGYKGDRIREYFAGPDCHEVAEGSWRVTLAETRLDANIGERLAQVAPLIAGEEMFLANYADGLSDFPLDRLIERVRDSDAVAGFLSVMPHHAVHFVERRDDDRVVSIRGLANPAYRINGGFFVFRREIFDFIEPGEELVEEPFRRLCERRRLVTVIHDGFWRCVDTLKDLKTLEAWLDDQEAQGRVYLRRAARPAAATAGG
jgi:glucose-1-phosphate cytidylyltransferase